MHAGPTLEGRTAPGPRTAAVAPIQIGNREYRCEKRFLAGTHRSAAPTETLERIRPYFREAGLTRLANITHFDRHGIPITVAIRPNSRTLATSSGKALTLDAALVSGAMEALELYCAETWSPEDSLLSRYADLRPDEAIPLDTLPLRDPEVFNANQLHRWRRGWDLLGGRMVAAPEDCVHLDFRCGNHDQIDVPFRTDSNGLASGNHPLEAISSALYEVIERDAITCWEEAARRLGALPPRVRKESVFDPQTLEAIERFDSAGLEVVLYDCTLDTGVPVYAAYWKDPEGSGLWAGFGAHLDPGVAMLRAVTEAAQQNTVVIAGARDNLFGAFYDRLGFSDPSPTWESMRAHPVTVDVGDRASLATPTFEGDLAVVLRLLREAGLERAIVLDLTRPDWDISVARVLVPGLEPYGHFSYVLGARARAFVEEVRALRADAPQPSSVALHSPAAVP